jgi:hypothetical protein
MQLQVDKGERFMQELIFLERITDRIAERGRMLPSPCECEARDALSDIPQRRLHARVPRPSWRAAWPKISSEGLDKNG